MRSGLEELDTRYEVGPDFECDGEAPRGAARLLTFGAADLRYHAGNLCPP